MAQSKPHRTILSRCLAALVLTALYCFSMVGATALLVGASSTAAFAQRGRGRGYARGVGRGYARGYARGVGRGYGRGYGYGGVYVAPGCYWRYGVRVCPY